MPRRDRVERICQRDRDRDRRRRRRSWAPYSPEYRRRQRFPRRDISGERGRDTWRLDPRRTRDLHRPQQKRSPCRDVYRLQGRREKGRLKSSDRYRDPSRGRWRRRNPSRRRERERERRKHKRDHDWSRERFHGLEIERRERDRHNRNPSGDRTEGRQESRSQSLEIVGSPSHSQSQSIRRNNQFVYACGREDLDRVRQLLAEGADVNSRSGGNFGVRYCIDYNNLELLELLLSQPEFIVNGCSFYGYLQFACFKHREDIVRRLCQVDGIDLNFFDENYGGTPLNESLNQPHRALGCVKLLVSHGAKVSQEDIQYCIQNLRGKGLGALEVLEALESLKALFEVCQPRSDLRLNVEPDRWPADYVAMLRLEEILQGAASRPLSLKQQCRNSIRDVLSVRSNGSSIWPYIERLELESALPECLVDYLLVFPDSEWRKKRADKVAESLNNIAVSDLVTVNCVD